MASTLPGTNSSPSPSSGAPGRPRPKPAPYRKLEDGEPYLQPKTDRVACCDCGLVHDVTWRMTPKGLEMKHYRNARATAQVRRGMVRRGEL